MPLETINGNTFNKLKGVIKHKYRTKSEWESTYANYILEYGELGFIQDEEGLFKIGDGIHKWSELSYAIKQFDITPIIEKTYTGVTCTANSDPAAYLYFGNIVPDSYTEQWEITYRIYATIAGSVESNVSYVTFAGIRNGITTWTIYNSITNGNYRAFYNHTIYRAKEAGVTNNYGHALGLRFYSSWNPNVAANARTIKVEIMDMKRCSFTIYDSMLLYANIPGTGTTNYDGRSEYDGTSNGFKSSGDNNDTTTIQLYYTRLTAGTNGLMQYSLCMMDSTGKYQSFTTNSGTGTTKTMNTTGFILGNMFYLNMSGNVTSGNVTGYGSVRAYQNIIDLRYSLNCGTSLTANKMVYLKGSITNGLFYIDTSTPYVQDLPTTADNKVYIPLGVAYDSYRIDFSGYNGIKYSTTINSTSTIVNNVWLPPLTEALDNTIKVLTGTKNELKLRSISDTTFGITGSQYLVNANSLYNSFKNGILTVNETTKTGWLKLPYLDTTEAQVKLYYRDSYKIYFNASNVYLNLGDSSHKGSIRLYNGGNYGDLSPVSLSSNDENEHRSWTLPNIDGTLSILESWTNNIKSTDTGAYLSTTVKINGTNYYIYGKDTHNNLVTLATAGDGTYYLAFPASTSSPTSIKYNSTIQAIIKAGTTSTNGYDYIVLGNNIKNGVAGNKIGYIRLYGKGPTDGDGTAGWIDVSNANHTNSSNYSQKLYPKNGNIALIDPDLVVVSKPSASGVTMNTVATYGNSMGMVNLTAQSSDTNHAIHPAVDTSNWHHYLQMSYLIDGQTTNMWQTQIMTKAGTTDLWIRSRSGGTISDTTVWTAGWTRILTGSNWRSVIPVTSKTASGLCPQLPNENTTTKYLRQDGTWQVPPNTTYTSLKNPYALSFKANDASSNTDSYDGSVAKTINIKNGGNMTIACATSNNVITYTITGTANTTYSAGNGMTLSGTTFSVGKKWNAVTQGQKWSRLYLATPVVTIEGSSGILSISCTRGNVVCNATFLITSSHASKCQIIELASTYYTAVRCRAIVNSGGTYYFEIYDTANSIASGTTQTWHCSFIPLLDTTLTMYTAFTDGSTVPDGYTAVNDFTTTNGATGAAIKNITRNGTTFTATRTDGTTFTFNQQDNNTMVTQNNSTGNASYRLLLEPNADDTNRTTTTIKSGNFYANPSTGMLYSDIFDAVTQFTPAAGKVTGLAAGHSRLYGNGLVISNPKTANDLAWLRVTGTGESDTVLEIATGDDAGVGEEIVVRQYNTNNNVGRQLTLLNKDGNTKIPGNLTGLNSLIKFTYNGTVPLDKEHLDTLVPVETEFEVSKFGIYLGIKKSISVDIRDNYLRMSHSHTYLHAANMLDLYASKTARIKSYYIKISTFGGNIDLEGSSVNINSNIKTEISGPGACIGLGSGTTINGQSVRMDTNGGIFDMSSGLWIRADNSINICNGISDASIHIGNNNAYLRSDKSVIRVIGDTIRLNTSRSLLRLSSDTKIETNKFRLYNTIEGHNVNNTQKLKFYIDTNLASMAFGEKVLNRKYNGTTFTTTIASGQSSVAFGDNVIVSGTHSMGVGKGNNPSLLTYTPTAKSYNSSTRKWTLTFTAAQITAITNLYGTNSIFMVLVYVNGETMERQIKPCKARYSSSTTIELIGINNNSANLGLYTIYDIINETAVSNLRVTVVNPSFLVRGNYSFATGESLLAYGNHQTVIGMWNASDTTSLFMIGAGTSSSARKNIVTVNSTDTIMKTTLVIEGPNSSYAEGLRINKGNGNYSTILLGGNAGSIRGTQDGAWWIGVNNTNSPRKLMFANNGSTATNAYFYAEDSGTSNISLHIKNIVATGNLYFDNAFIGKITSTVNDYIFTNISNPSTNGYGPGIRIFSSTVMIGNATSFDNDGQNIISNGDTDIIGNLGGGTINSEGTITENWFITNTGSTSGLKIGAGQITSGTLADARIPNLNTSKLTAGTLGLARGGTGKSVSSDAALLKALKAIGYTAGNLTATTAYTNTQNGNVSAYVKLRINDGTNDIDLFIMYGVTTTSSTNTQTINFPTSFSYYPTVTISPLGDDSHPLPRTEQLLNILNIRTVTKSGFTISCIDHSDTTNGSRINEKWVRVHWIAIGR